MIVSPSDAKNSAICCRAPAPTSATAGKIVGEELGKEAEARAEAAEVLRLNPKFSLEVHKERAPIKDPAVLERHLAALRQTGLK